VSAKLPVLLALAAAPAFLPARGAPAAAFPPPPQPLANPAHSPATGTGTPQADPLRLSLASVFSRIEEQNLDILVNRQAVEQAIQESFIARADLLPQLNLSFTQNRTQFVNVGRGFGGSLRPPPSDRFDAAVSATMSLLDFERYALWRAAKLGAEVSEAGQQVLLQDVLQQAGNAFFTHLRNLRRLAVIDANIARDTVLLGIARDRNQAGVATRLDVTRAEVRLAIDELDRLQQETEVNSSALRLRRLLDLDLDRGLALDAPAAQATEPPAAYTDVPLGQVFASRPLYRQATLSLREGESLQRAAGRARLPSLSAFADGGLAAEDPSLNEEYENRWTIGLEVSVPIFEGGRISAEERRAAARLRQRELSLARVENEIGVEYRDAVQQLLSRFRQISVAQRRVGLAREELRLARNRFEEGVADNSELVDAQASLAAAEDTVVEARYLYNLSRLAVLRAMGDVRRILDE